MLDRKLVNDVIAGDLDPDLLRTAMFEYVNSAPLPIRSRTIVVGTVLEDVLNLIREGHFPDIYDGNSEPAYWVERALLLGIRGRAPMGDVDFATRLGTLGVDPALVGDLIEERRAGAIPDEEFAQELGEFATDPVYAEVLMAHEQESLRAYLRRRVDKDHASWDLANEVADETLADCCTPFLFKYKGKGSLQGWIRATARNRLWNRLERANRFELVEVPEDREDDSVVPPLEVDPEIARKALCHAFTCLKQMMPRWLVVVRLHVIHNIPQHRLAKIFLRSDGDVSRDKTAALSYLHSEMWAYLDARDVHPTWDEMRRIFAEHLDLLRDEDHGDDDSGGL